MVTQDSPSNPTDTCNLQQLGSQNYDVFPPDLGSTRGTYQCQRLLPNIQFLGERMPRSAGSLHDPAMRVGGSNVDHTRHFMDLLGASNDVHNQAQKLSLSLGSCSLFPSVQCRETSLNQNIMNPGFMNPGIDRFSSTDYSLAGSSSLVAPIANSKYLRPARSLLEEVASVGGQATELSNEKFMRRLSRNSKNGSLGLRSALRVEFPTNELEAKIMKLITMLEEVNGAYLSHSQMHANIS